jgi:ketosteroid isomerase-like protein
VRLLSIEWEEGPFAETYDDAAWLAGIITLKVAAKGREFELMFRATFVLRREENRWKIRHEHVSGALTDPYGIGDWLKSDTV